MIIKLKKKIFFKLINCIYQNIKTKKTNRNTNS